MNEVSKVMKSTTRSVVFVHFNLHYVIFALGQFQVV